METIVSNRSFLSYAKIFLTKVNGKKCFEVYKDASLNLNWTKILRKECDKVGIDFFTSPYSLELVDHVNNYVQAYKIGSGDITWLEIIKHIAKKKKPVILASGASSIVDTNRALDCILKFNKKVC